MIVARTFRLGRTRCIGLHVSESQTLAVYHRPKLGRRPDQGWMDVAQLLKVAWWHDRRKGRTSWEPPGAVVLYLLVGLVVRVREGRR